MNFVYVRVFVSHRDTEKTVLICVLMYHILFCQFLDLKRKKKKKDIEFLAKEILIQQ